MDYDSYAKIIKAMADANRLKIIDLLSCGSMCACDLLKYFDFTQPTLSHHMKVLQAAGVVTAVKKGRWQHYSLVPNFTKAFPEFAKQLLQDDHTCVCRQGTADSCATTADPTQTAIV